MALPPDIHPASGCRLPLPDRAALPEHARAMYDGIADPKGPTLAGLRGPAGLLLHSPELARFAHALNAYLRWDSGLGGRLRELAILVTAREMDSQFEWAAHEAQALRDGLEPEIIDVVRHGRDTAGLAPADAALIDLGREAFRQHRVSPETFARALAAFGPKTLVDLVALIGNYAGTALLLAVFDMQLKPGQVPPLPLSPSAG